MKEKIALKFFITHSWSDNEFAKKLTDELTRIGYGSFLDVYSVKAGDDIPHEINRGLEECVVYIPILSVDSLKSKWCEREINAALMLSAEPNRKGRPVIIPILVEDCGSALPALLKPLRHINFTRRYDAALEELITRISDLEPAEQGRAEQGPGTGKTNIQLVTEAPSVINFILNNIGNVVGILLFLGFGLILLVSMPSMIRSNAPKPTIIDCIPPSDSPVRSIHFTWQLLSSAPSDRPRGLYAQFESSLVLEGNEIICLASSQDGRGVLQVDDQIEFQVTHTDGSIGKWIEDFYDRPDPLGGPGKFPQKTTGFRTLQPQNVSSLFAIGMNSIRVMLRDIYPPYNYYGSFPMYLVIWQASAHQ